MIDRSDEETAELVKAWIRRYGMTLLAGVVIALVSLFARDRWQEHQRERRNQFSAQLGQLQSAVMDKQLRAAEKRYAALREGETIYGDMAALVMAKLYHDKQDAEAALEVLQLARTAKDPLLAQTAGWSLLQLQLDEGEYDAALTTLASLRGSAYDSQLDRVQGDILLLQKKPRQALEAYRMSQKIQPAPLIRLRIDTLKAHLAIDHETARQAPLSSHAEREPIAEDS